MTNTVLTEESNRVSRHDAGFRVRLMATALVVLAGGTFAAPTASEYVQRGLVAHWDAADNIGYGQHDSSSETWKDLTGNGFDWSLDLDKVNWGNGKLYFNGAGGNNANSGVAGTMSQKNSAFNGRIKTIEIVMMASQINGDGIVFSPGFGDRTAGIAILNTQKAIVPYGHAGGDGSSSLGCAISAGSASIYRFVYDISGNRPSGLVSIHGVFN